ncbi:MAG: hypothetical protein M3Z36_02955 [Acidobacteriota bacterium]|nr:hypothetical protein [Acidobacteriota bacterium]
MNLEDELKGALRREEPARDFSLAFAAKPGRVRWRIPLGVAAALTLLAIVPYGIYERRQAEGREAKQRLVIALEVAGSKVLRTQKLLRNNSL